MRGTIKRDEQLKLYRTFLTFLAPTICFTFKHLRWCLFLGKRHGCHLHGQGLPIELVPVAGGPCTLARKKTTLASRFVVINVWWLYRWTKVSLPKARYFRCGSLFGNPNIIHILHLSMIYSLDQMYWNWPQLSWMWHHTLPKFNSSPLQKLPGPHREIVFKQQNFRVYVKLRGVYIYIFFCLYM